MCGSLTNASRISSLAARCGSSRLRAIEETLAEPDAVTLSITDPDAKLYYRRYDTTPFGDKLICVVVADKPNDAFVLTAYLTDRRKRGELLWAQES